MESNDAMWTGQSWRLPLWLWFSLAAMLLLITLIHVWWCVSLAAGAQGNGGGVASAAILGLGWTLLTNSFPIVECLPPCPYAAPRHKWHRNELDVTQRCPSTCGDDDSIAGQGD